MPALWFQPSTGRRKTPWVRLLDGDDEDELEKKLRLIEPLAGRAMIDADDPNDRSLDEKSEHRRRRKKIGTVS